MGNLNMGFDSGKGCTQFVGGAVGKAAFAHDGGLLPLQQFFKGSQQGLQLNRDFDLGQWAVIPRTTARQHIPNSLQGSQAVTDTNPQQQQAAKQGHDKGQASREHDFPY